MLAGGHDAFMELRSNLQVPTFAIDTRIEVLNCRKTMSGGYEVLQRPDAAAGAAAAEGRRLRLRPEDREGRPPQGPPRLDVHPHLHHLHQYRHHLVSVAFFSP